MYIRVRYATSHNSGGACLQMHVGGEVDCVQLRHAGARTARQQRLHVRALAPAHAQIRLYLFIFQIGSFIAPSKFRPASVPACLAVVGIVVCASHCSWVRKQHAPLNQRRCTKQVHVRGKVS